ncbi:MAG: hypothetical protein AB7M93_26085 [Candidatus Obscuribacterales bacterium]
MRLETYIRISKISPDKISAALGISTREIVSIILGAQPDATIAKKLEEFTKGAVTVPELINPDHAGPIDCD